MAEATAPQASPAIKGKFRIIGTAPGVCYTRPNAAKVREKVDLTTITLADAERLVKEGFEFLEPIQPDAPTASTEAEPEAEAEAKSEPEPPAPASTKRSRKTPAK